MSTNHHIEVFLRGQLHEAPFIKETDYGKTASITVAVNETYVNKTGERVGKHQLFHVYLGAKFTAEIKHLEEDGQIGDVVGIKGSLRHNLNLTGAAAGMVPVSISVNSPFKHWAVFGQKLDEVEEEKEEDQDSFPPPSTTPF